MLSQEILNAVEELMQDQMIRVVDISFRSYADLPEIRIQSKNDVPEQEVLSLINNSLCELKQNNSKLDFDYINCWGNSYRGETSEFEISLITSTTKEKAPVCQQEPQENIHLDYNSIDEIVSREA